MLVRALGSAPETHLVEWSIRSTNAPEMTLIIICMVPRASVTPYGLGTTRAPFMASLSLH